MLHDAVLMHICTFHTYALVRLNGTNLDNSTPAKDPDFSLAMNPGPGTFRVEILKRNGPGDGTCPLCETTEDSNHIFFECAFVQFLWSCFREVVGRRWCNSNFPGLFEELQVSAQQSRHIRWLGIGLLAWTL